MSANNQITIKGVVIPKHNTAAGWEVSDYVPAIGEKIVYDRDDITDYTRVKHGDGETLAKDLPFTIDPTVKDWAREDTIPSGVYVGSGPLPEDYNIGIFPEETDISIKSEAYIHNITLAYRDYNITSSKDDKSTGMCSIIFQLINDDPVDYSLNFASKTSKPSEYGKLQDMTAAEAWQLMRLYRANQLSTLQNDSREKNGHMVSGAILRVGVEVNAQGITSGYTNENDKDETSVRKLCVFGWHPQTFEGTYRMMPHYVFIPCGEAEFTKGDNPREIDELVNMTKSEFEQNYSSVNYPHYTVVCTDYVQAVKFKSEAVDVPVTPPAEEEEEEE